MKLTFSVLWFDDTEDFFDSLDINWLKNQIVEWGFSPDIKLVTTPQEFISYSPYEKIDLIVVDRNLEEHGEGQDFIAKIREHTVYTEVIFYTAGEASALWNAISEKKLEGVFVSNRGLILEKISKVGRQSIRKVLDIENMRGIVMAEVGQIDLILGDILLIGLSGLSEENLNTVFKRFHKEASKQNQEFSDRLARFIENPSIDELIEMCDSNKRWENFNRLWKYHDKLKDEAKFGDYKIDVLDLRNMLAHGSPTAVDGGYLFSHRDKEFLYNEAASEELRHSVMKYKDNFTKILRVLKN